MRTQINQTIKSTEGREKRKHTSENSDSPRVRNPRFPAVFYNGKVIKCLNVHTVKKNLRQRKN